MGREDEIRLIAYFMWEEEGRCDGCDIEHWLRAEAIWEEKHNKEASTNTRKEKNDAKAVALVKTSQKTKKHKKK
jgi:hypothetical protein